LARLVHYAVEAGGRSYALPVGLTSNRKVAELEIQPR
jgi:hypothetical protein